MSETPLRSTGRLAGRTAIVTGGSSGIGAATCRRFVDEGAHVLIADLQEDLGSALADELGESAAFLKVDVTREPDIEAAVDEAVSRWGSLDVMYNNAGFGGALGPIDTTSVEDYDITFDVLVKGVFLGIKHAARAMKPQGAGSIISTASVAGLQAGWSPHLYSVAKAAVIHLTRTVALELGADGIRVNCICPGIIATPLAAGRPNVTDEQLEKFKGALGRTQVLGRVGNPDDIAQAALWLASDDSSFTTGEAMVVDGGANAGRPWAKQGEWITEKREIRMYRPPDR